MNGNKLTQSDLRRNIQLGICQPVSSIEDDIIDQRLRAKQISASSSQGCKPFKLELIKIADFSEERTFAILRQTKKSATPARVQRDSLKNSSFATAADSLYRSNDFESPKTQALSVLSSFEFDKTSENATSTKKSSKRAEEVKVKLILGLSALAGTFDKVQSKDVAFRFAHLKIFSQLSALNENKKQKNEPVKALVRPGQHDKKTKFYRQWFKTHRSSQMTDVSSGAEANHTLAMRP